MAGATTSLLPYFRRSEHFEPGESPWHGRGGELNVAAQRSPGPINQVFFQAAEEMGWPYNADFNGERQEGIGPFHVTQVNGERWRGARLPAPGPGAAQPQPGWRGGDRQAGNCRHAAK